MNHVLSDFEQIRALKARYCRFIDTKQWDALRELLTRDVELSFYDVGGALLLQVSGLDEVMTKMPAYMNPAQSMHQVSHHELELLSPTTARGIWAMHDIVSFTNPADSPDAVVEGYGYYHERYVKTGDTWRIQGFRLERVKYDLTPWPAAATTQSA